jgi:hypothetical protein
MLRAKYRMQYAEKLDHGNIATPAYGDIADELGVLNWHGSYCFLAPGHLQNLEKLSPPASCFTKCVLPLAPWVSSWQKNTEQRRLIVQVATSVGRV